MFANITSFLALLISAIGVYFGYWVANQIAKRNENKILAEDLLSTIKEMHLLSEEFFNKSQYSKLSIKFYSDSFSTRMYIASFLVYLLKEQSKLLKSDIDKPLSDFHKSATFDVEKINGFSIEKRVSTYAEITKFYLECVRIIHQSFQSKYH